MSIYINPEIQKALTDLGWPEIPNGRLTHYNFHRSSTEYSIYVRAVKSRQYSTAPDKFVVGCDYDDATRDDKIESITIDPSKPKWVQTLFRWHTTTTFKLAEIRAKYSERDQREKRHQLRRKAHAEELRLLTGNTGLLSASGTAIDGGYTVMRVSLTVINMINENLARLNCITSEAKRGAELLGLLKSHGFIK